MNHLIKYCFVLSLLLSVGVNSGAARSIILSKCKHIKALGIGSIDGKTIDQIQKINPIELSNSEEGTPSTSSVETEEETKEQRLNSVLGNRDGPADASLTLKLLCERHKTLFALGFDIKLKCSRTSLARHSLLSVYII